MKNKSFLKNPYLLVAFPYDLANLAPLCVCVFVRVSLIEKRKRKFSRKILYFDSDQNDQNGVVCVNVSEMRSR